VGAVAYELLAYQRAFHGDITDGVLHRILHEPPPPLQKAVPGIDPALVQVIDTALAKNREQRYQNLDDMRAALTQVRQHLKMGAAASQPLPPRPPSPEALTPVSSKVSSAGRPAPTRDVAARLRYLVDSARRALDGGFYDEALAAATQAL